MIFDATSWDQARKDAAIDHVFDHPHPFTIEDVEWSKGAYGFNEAQCRQIFRDAPTLGVMLKDDVPLYIFAVQTNKTLSTASEERLAGLKRYMTKELVRFGKSELGRHMLAPAIAFAEESDVLNGTVRHQWAKACGFEPYATAEFNGQTFFCYSFRG